MLTCCSIISWLMTRHRTDYIVGRNRQIVYNCEKLKFYCNTAKTQDGGYSTNDTMTPAVPTRCNGQKEQGPGVTEGKQVWVFSENFYVSLLWLHLYGPGEHEAAPASEEPKHSWPQAPAWLLCQVRKSLNPLEFRQQSWIWFCSDFGFCHTLFSFGIEFLLNTWVNLHL